MVWITNLYIKFKNQFTDKQNNLISTQTSSNIDKYIIKWDKYKLKCMDMAGYLNRINEMLSQEKPNEKSLL